MTQPQSQVIYVIIHNGSVMNISMDKLNGTGKKALMAINIAVVIALGTGVFVIVRDTMLNYFVPDKPVKKESAAMKNTDKKNLTDYSPILKNNPFGFPGGELKQISEAKDVLSQEQAVDFTLIGTIVSSGKKSYAIFQNKEGKQDLFGTGGPVFGVGILKSVSKDTAMLNVNGSKKEIKLADAMVIKDIKAATSKPLGIGGNLGVKKEGSLTVLDQGKIRQALDNPNQVMTDARFIPHLSGNKQEGFSINEVRPGGIYSSLGLMNGDVILRINEYNISSPETALQAFTALKGMEKIQLDIIRAGNKMTMTYLIK